MPRGHSGSTKPSWTDEDDACGRLAVLGSNYLRPLYFMYFTRPWNSHGYVRTTHLCVGCKQHGYFWRYCPDDLQIYGCLLPKQNHVWYGSSPVDLPLQHGTGGSRG